MNEVFEYAKQKWDKSHKVPDFKVGDLVLVSTLNFSNIKGPKKLKHSYVGYFLIVALHGTNAVQVELSGELENTHPTFPVSLINPHQCHRGSWTEKQEWPGTQQSGNSLGRLQKNKENKIKS
ncbi:hypothetical protein O181_101805 [Austropuccinia psidii MF-1]|uniref:Tf2-1-like SH3-like domain-containing protein n=1 Tax=Austropuccinia psidii MF-1 TaxID=1389203 RepID=A0A9Q3JID2_9BASI|nr:hypothetical protein [Austropuccinia psidii MF-1]